MQVFKGITNICLGYVKKKLLKINNRVITITFYFRLNRCSTTKWDNSLQNPTLKYRYTSKINSTHLDFSPGLDICHPSRYVHLLFLRPCEGNKWNSAGLCPGMMSGHLGFFTSIERSWAQE